MQPYHQFRPKDDYSLLSPSIPSLPPWNPPLCLYLLKSSSRPHQAHLPRASPSTFRALLHYFRLKFLSLLHPVLFPLLSSKGIPTKHTTTRLTRSVLTEALPAPSEAHPSPFQSQQISYKHIWFEWTVIPFSSSHRFLWGCYSTASIYKLTKQGPSGQRCHLLFGGTIAWWYD